MKNPLLEKVAYQYQHMLKDRSRLYAEGEHEFDNTGIGHITPSDLATAEKQLLSEDEDGNEIRPSLADMLDHVKRQKARLHADQAMTSLYGLGVEETAHDIKNKGVVGRGALHMLSAGAGALAGSAMSTQISGAPHPLAVLGGAGVALGASLLAGSHAADKHERSADEFIARSSNKYLQKSAAISKQDYKKESSTGRAIGSYLLAGTGAGVVGSGFGAVAGQSAMRDFHAKEHHIPDSLAEKYRAHRNLNNVKWYREDYPGVGPAFDFQSNTIHSKGNLTGMHEMGHAHSFNSSTPQMRKAKTIAYGLGRNQLGVLAGSVIALHGDSKESTAAGTAVAAASMAPMLIEEGRASIDPHNFIKKHGTPAQSKAFGRTMGKAFGSYAALAAAGAATPYLSRKVYDNFTQRAIDKRKSK